MFDDNNGWDGDGGMGEQGERKRHTKLAKQNISRVGGTNGFTVWLVDDQFSTFTEKKLYDVLFTR